MTLNHNYGCSNEAVTGIAGNVWCFAKAGLRRTNVELTTKDN